jgi:hypothetical protein
MIAFFPTYARRTATGWQATVAGMVSRPLPEMSRRRSLLVAVLKRLLENELEAGEFILVRVGRAVFEVFVIR